MVAFLVAVDCDRDAIEALMVLKKGPPDDYGCKSMARFIDSLGSQHIVLQGDGEPAMQAVLRKIKSLCNCSVIVRSTPRYSSKSNGKVENANKILEGFFRTMKSFIEAQYDVKIGLESFMLPWMIRHAAWIATVFHKRADGHSSYFRIRGHEYYNSVVPFGESAMMRIPGHKNKFESCWLTGIWLDRSMQSN